MNELFYFAFADLMVRVEYNEVANALRYASHRKITSGERMIVEQYLLISIATKTDYYKHDESQFIYLGVEARLFKAFENFHCHGTAQRLNANDKDVAVVVESLINQSMQNYYFEQIGDTIVAMRQEFKNGAAPIRVTPFRQRMEKLVEAYNHYAGQKISVAEVIPAELHPHFGLPVRPRAYARSFVDDENE